MPTKTKAAARKVYCRVCPDWEIKHPDRCSNTLTQRGATLYFCTRRCKERFLKAPAAMVEGATLGDALGALFASRPALRGYILDDQGALRRHVAIYVNGQPARDRVGLSDPLGPRDEIYVFQALSGG